MLKITTIHDDGCVRRLKLEGKLLADWVGELQAACRLSAAESRRLGLDLGGILFLDVAGTTALRELVRQGVTITASSPFVRETLKES